MGGLFLSSVTEKPGWLIFPPETGSARYFPHSGTSLQVGGACVDPSSRGVAFSRPPESRFSSVRRQEADSAGSREQTLDANYIVLVAVHDAVRFGHTGATRWSLEQHDLITCTNLSRLKTAKIEAGPSALLHPQRQLLATAAGSQL